MPWYSGPRLLPLIHIQLQLHPKILLLVWSQGNCLSHWCQGSTAATKAASKIFSTCHFSKSFHGVPWTAVVTNRDSPWVMLQWIYESELRGMEEEKDLLSAGEEPGVSWALQEILLCNPQGIKDKKNNQYWDGKWELSSRSAAGCETMPWPATRTNRTWDLEDPGHSAPQSTELKN